MGRNRRFGGLNLFAVMAGLIFLLPVFGSAGANAQRRPADDSDLFRPQNPVPEVSVSGQRATEIRRQPQSDVPGLFRPGAPTGGTPSRPFTLATSVGTIDEDSSAIVQLRNFTVTFLPGATGSVHARYNITAVDDISSFCPATQSSVKVRFRNNDNTGTLGQVSFEIRSTSITAGGNNILYTFSSNGRGAGGSFTTATDTPAIDFDFANNIYWIEATVFRSDPALLSDLGSIQIWESSGTACP